MTDRELVAAYVLGELEAPDLAAFESRLDREPSLRSEVEEMARLTAGLETLPADAWPAAAEPEAPGVRAGRAREVPAAAPARRWYARPALALAAVAAALLVGVALGALIEGGSGGSGGGKTTSAGGAAVALKPLGGSRAHAIVRVADDGTVELDTHGLPRSGKRHYYELWLMTDAAKTVPIASFAVGEGGAAKVRVPLPADPEHFRYYDISRQRVDGGTAHSTESVLRGPTG